MDSGEIYLDGVKLPVKSPYHSIKNGIGMITENRRGTGFMDNFEVWRNLVIVHSMKKSSFEGLWGLIHKKEEIAIAEEYSDRMQIKCTTVQQMMTTLSGGNQQKVIIAKWLAAKARLLIFDEPTRGIDVGAKNEIYHTMRNLANDGKGIIMVSSELPELLSVCDRIMVFGGGRIRLVLRAAEATEEKIMMAAI
jgi:D-allose transport system ATP-binding protein